MSHRGSQALVPRGRTSVAPANRVTVLDPPVHAEPDGQPVVLVYIDTINLVQPAALPAPRVTRQRPPARRRRRTLHPATRAVVRPVASLLAVLALVYIAARILGDPTLIPDQTWR